jgi:hypothetical protein
LRRRARCGRSTSDGGGNACRHLRGCRHEGA